MNEILLSDVVAWVESGGNILAMRYEPLWIPQNASAVKASAVAGYMDEATADMICKCSWGKYQIMGDNLYGPLGFKSTLFDLLSSPSLQLELFRKFIGLHGFNDAPFLTMLPNDLIRFAMAYNGSAVYADSLRKAYTYLTAP